MKTYVLKSLLVAMFFATQLFTHAQSLQGPLNPTLATEQAAGCLSCPGASWNNHLNSISADSVNTVVQLNPHSQCFFGMCYARGLVAYGFGFNIPSNAVTVLL